MTKEFYSENGKKGAMVNREKAIKRYYKDPAYCKCCGKVIALKDGDIPSRVKQKAFCSSECRSLYQSKKMMGNNIKKREPIYCLNCGKELNSHQYKYCSNQCQRDYAYKIYIDKWKNGLVDGLASTYQTSEYIRKYLKEKYNNKCCKCGWDKINLVTGNSPLEVHHIDGNYKNNAEDNLELLCPNCHSLTENYKGLNKNGRKERYK